MDWTRIEKGKAKLCATCHRIIRIGQVGVSHKFSVLQVPAGDRTVWWHAKCIVADLADVPPDTDQQAFNCLRDKIAATGVAFPD